MTTLPIELAKARTARTEAWNQYMQIIDREHTAAEFHEALTKAGQADKICDDLYRRWQAVGGTSDIESIEAAELEAERRKALQIVLDVASTQKPHWMIEAIALERDAQDWQDQITELRNG